MKPARTLEEQLSLLVDRGLSVSDEAKGRRYLYDTNYYRLSGFARQFQLDPKGGNDQFRSDVTLEQMQVIVRLDTDLSLAMASCLGILERIVRARFAYELAHSFGNDAFFLDHGSYLAVTPSLNKLIEKAEDELLRAKSPTAARYALGTDLSKVPVWVAFELLSFGTVSRMLEYLADRGPRELVAGSFSELKATFPSTVHSLAVLRNRCAHHGQHWHRFLTIQTPLVRKERRNAPKFDHQGLYPAFLAMRRMLRGIEGTVDLVDHVEQLMTASDQVFSDGILNPRPA